VGKNGGNLCDSTAFLYLMADFCNHLMSDCIFDMSLGITRAG